MFSSHHMFVQLKTIETHLVVLTLFGSSGFLFVGHFVSGYLPTQEWLIAYGEMWVDDIPYSHTAHDPFQNGFLDGWFESHTSDWSWWCIGLMLRAALLMLCLVMTAFAMRANDGTMPGHSSAMEVQQDVKEDADGKFCDMCHSAWTNSLLEGKEVLKVVFGMKAPKKMLRFDKMKNQTTTFASKKTCPLFWCVFWGFWRLSQVFHFSPKVEPDGSISPKLYHRWTRWTKWPTPWFICCIFVVMYGTILYTQLTVTNT